MKTIETSKISSAAAIFTFRRTSTSEIGQQCPLHRANVRVIRRTPARKQKFKHVTALARCLSEYRSMC